jgi:formate-dependent nitrite reductase cytochrome c552 subunit
MRPARILIPALAAAAALAPFLSTGASGSDEIAAKERISCTACHDKPGSKLLTDEGKFYEVMRTTDGFEALEKTFGRCTSCHDTRPGSQELTEKGEQFRALVTDMEGLAEWMKQHHPEAPAEEQPKEPRGR